MGLRIRTNVQSLTAQRHLGLSRLKQEGHAAKLASGRRINKAADDAAGLAIAEGLRADIRSLQQAQRNANDAVAMIQVAEGGLEEINSVLTRLRELSIQSASDTIGKNERSYLNQEFMALKDEIDRIVLATEFNGTKLLIGKGDGVPEELLEGHNPPPLEMQVGKDYVLPVDALEAPNPVNIIKINLEKIDARIASEDGLRLGYPTDEDGTRVDHKQGAQQAIARLDEAIQKVSSFRATLGAYQNRLGSAERNLGVRIENLTAAKSRIVDADFAFETAELTKANILMQAGSAILSQANQFPNTALELVKNI